MAGSYSTSSKMFLDLTVLYIPALNKGALKKRYRLKALSIPRQRLRLPRNSRVIIALLNIWICYDESPGHSLSLLFMREDMKAMFFSPPTLVQSGVVLKAVAPRKHILGEIQWRKTHRVLSPPFPSTRPSTGQMGHHFPSQSNFDMTLAKREHET